MGFIQKSGLTLVLSNAISPHHHSISCIVLDFRAFSANIPTAITIDHRIVSNGNLGLSSPDLHVRMGSGTACAYAYLATATGRGVGISTNQSDIRSKDDPSGHSLVSQSGQKVVDLPAVFNCLR